MTTFIDLFADILNGNRQSSHQAARAVRKQLYSPSLSYKNRHSDIQLIIEIAAAEYYKIKQDWRQENFVLAVSVIYYLHDYDKSPEFLFAWVFDLLQHSNGNIRQAARRMINHELGPLTAHIRYPDMKFEHRFTPDEADLILLSLYVNLNNLAVVLSKPSYKKYKYVDSLPTSPYKTVEMTFIDMEESCGKAYMKRLYDQAHDLIR
jgi:hypothetical protein